MSEFALNELHVDSHLTNIAITRRPTGFVADILAPIVVVPKQSDSYTIWGQENFRAPKTARAKGAPVNEVQFSVSSAKFYCSEHALEHVIPLQDLANADAGLKLREHKTMMLTDNMWEAWEGRVASAVTSTSNVGSSVTLSGSTTGQFSDFANSEPVLCIRNGMASVRAGAKRPANTIVFSFNVWDKFIQHPQIQNLLFPHGGGIPTPELVARIFFGSEQGGRVLVADSIKNTGEENQTNAFSDNWSGDVLIAHIAPRAGIDVPSYMYTFRWQPSEFPAPLVVGSQIFSGPGTRDIEVIRTQMFQDEHITASDMGYLIKAAV